MLPLVLVHFLILPRGPARVGSAAGDTAGPRDEVDTVRGVTAAARVRPRVEERRFSRVDRRDAIPVTAPPRRRRSPGGGRGDARRGGGAGRRQRGVQVQGQRRRRRPRAFRHHFGQYPRPRYTHAVRGAVRCGAREQRGQPPFRRCIDLKFSSAGIPCTTFSTRSCSAGHVREKALRALGDCRARGDTQAGRDECIGVRLLRVTTKGARGLEDCPPSPRRNAREGETYKVQIESETSRMESRIEGEH